MRSTSPVVRALLSRGGRIILMILIAKGRFAPDRLQTLFKGRKAAICGTTGEIRAPLNILLIVPRLGRADGAPDNENPGRNRQCSLKSVERRHFVERSSSGSFAILAAMRRASSWVRGPSGFSSASAWHKRRLTC
jgi:hypothetical protein